MSETYLFWPYLGALAAALPAAFLAWTGRVRATRWTGLVGTGFCAVCVGLIIYLTDRPPLFGLLESLISIAFLLGLAAWRSERTINLKGLLSKRFWTLIALILLSLLFLPRRLNPDFYMYDYPWTILFFVFRLTAVAVLLSASVYYLAALEAKNSPDLRGFLFQQGRTFLILGGAFFLAGEFSGSVWSLNWLGDFWRWSRGFFESTAMFLLISAAFHLPAKWSVSTTVRAVFGAAPGLLILGLTIIHQLME